MNSIARGGRFRPAIRRASWLVHIINPVDLRVIDWIGNTHTYFFILNATTNGFCGSIALSEAHSVVPSDCIRTLKIEPCTLKMALSQNSASPI